MRHGENRVSELSPTPLRHRCTPASWTPPVKLVQSFRTSCKRLSGSYSCAARSSGLLCRPMMTKTQRPQSNKYYQQISSSNENVTTGGHLSGRPGAT